MIVEIKFKILNIQKCLNFLRNIVHYRLHILKVQRGKDTDNEMQWNCNSSSELLKYLPVFLKEVFGLVQFCVTLEAQPPVSDAQEVSQPSAEFSLAIAWSIQVDSLLQPHFLPNCQQVFNAHVCVSTIYCKLKVLAPKAKYRRYIHKY